MKSLAYVLGILLGFFLAFHIAVADECGQTPTDHCTISQSTTFTPGVYTVENITIIANDTVVDCNGAVFDRIDATVFRVGGTQGVTIKNCRVTSGTTAVTNRLASPGEIYTAVEQLTVSDNIFEGGNIQVYLNNNIINYTPSNVFPNHQIINNTFTDGGGIYLISINNSIIRDNAIENAFPPDYEGIVFDRSANNIVENNNLSSAKIHILTNSPNTTIQSNTISDVYLAMQLDLGSDGTFVRRNVVTRVGQGMVIRSSNHYIRGNFFSGNDILDGPEGGSSRGIEIDGTGVNTPLPNNITIFLNLFDNMVEPTYDTGANNSWDGFIRLLGQNFSFGNFYGVFYRDNQSRRGLACVDLNFDNICDNPYTFDMNGRDNFPMRSRSSPEGLGNGGGWSINSPSVDPIAPFYLNEVDLVHVVVIATSPLNLSLRYDIKDEQGQVDPRFIPVPGRPNEFTWDTDLLSAGNYTFFAVATDELDLNGGTPFEVHISDSNTDCRNYLPRVINGCEIQGNTVFSPGTYNIPNGLRFTVNNAILDCNGAILDNNNANVPGIYLLNRQNIEIHNCQVQHNTRGLLVQGSTNVLVDGSRFSNSVEEGIKLENSQNVRLEQNTITLTQWGIRFYSSNNNHLINNQIVNNENGQITLYASSANNITENNVSDLQFNGPIELDNGATSNFIYRNNFQNYVTYPWSTGANNLWTVQNQGNYWSNWNTQPNGLPHVCINNDWNALCENPYKIRPATSTSISDTAPFARPDGWKKPYPQMTVSSTTPTIGQPVTFRLVDADMANQPYLFAMDLAPAPSMQLSDGRMINLVGTGVFMISLLYGTQLGFAHSGTFDDQGVATVTWYIPPIPDLHGLPLFFTIIPFDGSISMPQAVLTTYRSVGVTLQR